MDSIKLGVTHKLFVILLLAASLTVIASTLVMQWSLNRGFLRFINAVETEGIPRMAAALEEEYRKSSGWEELRNSPMRWLHIMATTLPEGAAAPPADQVPTRTSEPLPPHLTQQFDRRLFLQDADGKFVIGHADDLKTSRRIPLRHEGAMAGYLGLLPRTTSPSQQRFLKEQQMALVIMAAVIIALSAVLSLLSAKRLVRPIAAMADVARKLASGSYDQRAPVMSSDELGRLARDLNSLAVSLGRNEAARRQLVQDLSHEFRTPLTFLRSQIEALIDGVRQPDMRALHALHHEVVRLGRLVDDLYQLSLSDAGAQAYRKEEMDLDTLFSEVMEHYAGLCSTRGITLLNKSVMTNRKMVYADPVRLRQLFTNLLDNAMKYTDRGGKVEVEIVMQEGLAIVNIMDSAPGVSSDDLPRLFDRLYRVESSRNRATGGSGLGLSICRKIVEAHEGTIEALPSPLGGVWIKVKLPCGRLRQ